MSFHETQWKSEMLNISKASEGVKGIRRQHQRAISTFDKENVSANRALIRIKPKKFAGICHFLCCPEGDRKSELIRLER